MLLNYAMLQKTAVVTGIALIVCLNTSYTSFFGLKYDNTKDFVCCKNNQLVMHHYFRFNVLCIPVYDGYTEENMGKPDANACDIRCND
jgi:hypothetical protein